MLLVIAAVALGLGQTEPSADESRYSAQCLMEVAALSGETFDIWDDRYRAAAQAKADRIVELHTTSAASIEELRRAQAAWIDKVAEDERAGRLPPGSAEVERRRRAAELADLEATTSQSRTQLPSCGLI